MTIKNSFNGFFIILLLCITAISFTSSNVIIANEDMNKMIEFSTIKPYCRILKDRDTINFVYESRPNYVKIVDDDHFNYIEEECRNDDDSINAIQRGLKFIYPGTNWCGPGTVAKNYSDLGVHYKEDACCREHDNCPRNLESGQCLDEVCNESKFTRSHCDCDKLFQKCLREAETETANTIGAIFFNVIRVICFREEEDCSNINSDKKCNIKFIESEQYVAPAAPYHPKNRKAFFLNKFLRSLRLL